MPKPELSRTAAAGEDHARHRALVYDDAVRFVEVVSAFVRDGLTERDRVLVATTTEKQAWLRDALGDAAQAVEWADAQALYARYGPMFAEVVGFLARHGTPGFGRARIVAEQSLGRRTNAERRAYMRYEAAANVAYQPFAASVLCPYDASSLPDDVVDDALRTHPEVVADDGPHASKTFIDPREFIRLRSRIQPPPRGAAKLALEDLTDLARARSLVAGHAAAAGFAPDKIEDLEVAASEAATNALLHGAPPRCLWLYEHDGMLVCHVHDGGRGLTDPLTGYLSPAQRTEGGRGLWITHQICDIVETGEDDSGSHVYLGVRL